GVPHPAFLRSSALSREAFEDGERSSVDVDLSAVDAVVVPTGRDHLRQLVDDTLTDYFGHPPERDDDDDIPVNAGSGMVYVRIRTDFPVVELFAAVMSQIQDEERAQFEVSVLNRDSMFIRYTLVDDRVMAYLHVPCYPFIPHQLN